MTQSSVLLGIRSIVWAALLPGMVAGFVPWRFFAVSEVRLDPGDPIHLLGLTLIAVGAPLLAHCIWEFARSGRGTLSPMDSPNVLVVRGLYRYVRNPMYLSVTTVLLGEVLLTRSRPLLVYWAIWFGIVNLFVMGYEEPRLRRLFGASYEAYTERVGRWIPRIRRAGPLDDHNA